MLNFGCFSDVSFSCLCSRFCPLPVCVLMKAEAQRLVGNVSSQGCGDREVLLDEQGRGRRVYHSSRVSVRFRLLLLMRLTCQATKFNLSYQEKQLIVLGFLCMCIII